MDEKCDCKICREHKGIPESITVGIYTDFSMTMEPEEEWAEMIEELEDIGLNIGGYKGSLAPQEILEYNPDLLIVDYGGMSVAGCSDTMTSNVRHFCRWAEDHPGKLMVVWTHTSTLFYRQELESEFGHLNNIILRSGLCDSEEFDPKIQSWFGVDYPDFT